MFMRNHWLKLAMMITVISWTSSILQYVLCCITAYYFYRKQRKCIVFIMILLFLCLCRFHTSPKVLELSNRFYATVHNIKNAYIIADVQNQKIVLYGLEDASFKDTYQVEADCQPMEQEKNFYLFDFSKYLRKRNITTSCFVKKATLIKQSDNVQAKIYRYIQQMSKVKKDWLLSTLYGIHEQEVSYFISSTGMHLSYISNVVTAIFLLWFSLPLATCISLMMIAGIGYITVWKDSLTRIIIFRIVPILFPNSSKYDCLGISMIITILLIPYISNELTFILPVMFRLAYLFNIQKRKRLCITFGILIPIQFYYFYCIHIMQVLLFPYLRKGYAFMYILALLSLFFPVPIFMYFAQCLHTALTYIQQMTFTFYYIPNVLFLILWFFIFFQWLGYHNARYFKYLCLLFLFTQISPYFRPYMEVWMMNVGQGDCFVISLPFQQGNIMIDIAGHKERDIPKDIVIPQLKAKGIKSIDTLIITHDDFDHSGGLQQLQEGIKIKEIIDSKDISTFLKGNIRFSFLLNQHHFSNVNENSLILYFEAYDTRFLFMGDAGVEAEQSLLQTYPNLQADILKVGHHGSKTSSSLPFVHQIHPKFALISSGIHNMYGHPHKEVIERLQKEKATILNTAKDGAISIKLTNFIRIYKTTQKEFGIIRTGE